MPQWCFDGILQSLALPHGGGDDEPETTHDDAMASGDKRTGRENPPELNMPSTTAYLVEMVNTKQDES